MSELSGRAVLITGAGRGLGAATARELAAAGALLALVDRDEDAVSQVAADLTPLAPRAVPIVADLLRDDDLERAVAHARSLLGRLDVLVNNAGLDYTRPIEELTVEEIDRVLAVNLRAPFVLARAVWPIFRAQGGGQIVNVCSTAARRAWPNASAYHASKWGLLGLSYALLAEGRPHNIRVTAVIPGGMRTPFLLERFPDLDPATLLDPARVAATIRSVLCQPPDTVVAEVTVLPMGETSWP